MSKSTKKRKVKGKGIDLLYPVKKTFQVAANTYRKNFCQGKARPLEFGELHYGCHNYTGPGTRIDLYPNYPPYNDIDNCSRTHDLDYQIADKENNKILKAQIIRKADEDAINCYNKFPNENGYTASKMGINGKMKIENALPFLIRNIAPNYSGKGCDMYPLCKMPGFKSGGELNVFGVKPKESFTKSINKGMDLIAYDKNKIIPFGSFVFRAQPYAGDIDIFETVDLGTNDINIAINEFEKNIKKIIKKVKTTRATYLGDVKAGIDHEYDQLNEFLGKWDNMKLINFDIDNFYNEANTLYNEGLIENKDMEIIEKILKNIDNVHNWDELYELVRKYRIVRWKENELLQGYKKLIGNRIKYLNDALKDKSPVKIDIWTNIGGDRYVEMTNFFILKYEDNGNIHLLNLPDNYFKLIVNNLKKEVEKLFYSDYYFKPFKGVKRMWSIAKALKDQNMLNKLLNLIRSDASLANQINAEIEVMIMLLEKIKNPPLSTIKKQIDNFKSRLANIYELDFSDEIDVYRVINEIIKSKSKSKIIENLKNIKNYLMIIIDKYTINELEKLGLWPIPRNYLPNNKKYNTNL